MLIVLGKLVGILIIGLGGFFLFSPDSMRKLMAFWKEGNRAYWGGVIRIVFGVILLLAATQSEHPLIAAELGIVFLVSGVLVYMIGLEKLRVMISWWQDASSTVLRLMAVVSIIFGMLILTAV